MKINLEVKKSCERFSRKSSRVVKVPRSKSRRDTAVECICLCWQTRRVTASKTSGIKATRSCWLKRVPTRRPAVHRHRNRKRTNTGGRSGWFCGRKKSFPTNWSALVHPIFCVQRCRRIGGRIKRSRWLSKWSHSAMSSMALWCRCVRETTKIITANCETTQRQLKTT